MKPKERDFVEPISQEKLIQRIQSLCEQITAAGIADATAERREEILYVRVKYSYAVHPVISTAPSLSGEHTILAFTNKWNLRLQDLIHDLQKILDAGQGPNGEAA